MVNSRKLSHSVALLALALAAAPAAHAFDLLNLDVNKVIGVGKSVGKAVTGIGEPEEIELGNGIAATLLGAAPLVADEQVQRYVNRVGLWLARHTERPDLPWRFGVIDSPYINAFAVPGGQVFITRGLFVKLKSEAELAGALSHEIAHIVKKQHLAEIQKKAGIDALKGAADVASSQSSDSRYQHLGKVLNVGTGLYINGLSKSDEYEADRMGVVIAARSGYDPFGLPAVLQMMQTISPSKNAMTLLLKSHPAPVDRLDALDKAVGDKLDSNGGVEKTATFETMRKRLSVN